VAVHRKKKESAVEQRLWLAELFLTEEGEVAEAEDDLEEHADPESWVAQTIAHIVGQCGVVRQWASRGKTVGTVDDGANATNDLRKHQGEGDVETRKGLEEKHTDADTLEGVENSEPKPEATTKDSRANWATSPRQVVTHVGNGPPNLAPSRSTKRDCKHGQDPTVRLGKSAEKVEDTNPQNDEEEDDQENNGVGRCVLT
jgi:hypothetical protein